MKFPKNEGGGWMSYSVNPWEKGAEMGLSPIFNRGIFLYLLDLEVKRARRYQNFFSVLILKIVPLSRKDDGRGLPSCVNQLSHLLREEFRESDILGSLGENKLAALLPYADVSAGGQARSHFQASLEYCDFQKEGYEVKIEQFCFPFDGTDTRDLLKKVIGPEGN
jgi:PleD family two-component response regulator